MIHIYLDENLSEHVADALNSLSQGYFKDVTVSSTINKFGKAAKDEDIIPGIGKEHAILITRDLNIYRLQVQNELCKEHKIGAFFIKLPKGQDKHWELVKLLLNNWEEILTTCSKAKTPFAYRVKVKGKMEKLY